MDGDEFEFCWEGFYFCCGLEFLEMFGVEWELWFGGGVSVVVCFEVDVVWWVDY